MLSLWTFKKIIIWTWRDILLQQKITLGFPPAELMVFTGWPLTAQLPILNFSTGLKRNILIFRWIFFVYKQLQ